MGTVILCGWEGNRRFGIALYIRYTDFSGSVIWGTRTGK